MNRFAIEPMTAEMWEASNRLREHCLDASELAFLIDEACGGDQRKAWNVAASVHWGLAFTAMAMMYPDEDEFVRVMKGLREDGLRAKHREVHDQDPSYDVHL